MNKNLCCICLSNESTISCKPCNHLILCDCCFFTNDNIDNPKIRKCPLCRTIIRELVEVNINENNLIINKIDMLSDKFDNDFSLYSDLVKIQFIKTSNLIVSLREEVKNLKDEIKDLKKQ
jgi:hypothetical protein